MTQAYDTCRFDDADAAADTMAATRVPDAIISLRQVI